MEQFGWLLSELIPGAVRCADSSRAPGADGRAAARRRSPLDGLPASWEVTSDSIAAWVAAGRRRPPRAGQGGRRLFAEWPARGDPIARMTAAELGRCARRAWTSTCPRCSSGARFETWVISGRDPARLVELLEHGAAVGTRIA